MPWTYSQHNGRIYHDGSLVGIGYAGKDDGKDNPAAQNLVGIGPIPRGTYTIGAPFTHPHAGVYTLRLAPQSGTNTFGRSGFMMHGDSIEHPGHASDGCIIQNLMVRRQVWESGDHTLEVVQ